MANTPNFSGKDKLAKDVEVEKPVFDIQFQAGLLKLCLKDDYFCAQCVRYLGSDQDLDDYIVFDSAQFHFIFQIINRSLEEYKTRPTEAQVRTAIMEFAEDEREPYFKALEVIQNADTHNEEFYRKYITAFVQQVKMAKGFKKTRSIWKDRPGDAPDYLQKVIDGIRRVHFEKEDVMSLSHVYSFVKKDGEDDSKIPTGLTRLDEDLRGGFPRETLVTVLGSSNAGKSIFCSSLGCSALRAGFKVLHINLEGTRDEVVFRYLSNLADIPFFKIEEQLLTPFEKAKMDEAVNKYDKNLKVRNMLNFGITIEDVIAYCRETYKDFPFDMLVVDYGQLLKTKDKNEKFDRQTEVYRGLDSISKEFHCVVVSPAQSTREGMRKQNQFGSMKKFGVTEEKLPVLRSDDLADCIEIARVSAIIITLNRTEEEEQRGWVRVFLEKQRRGRKAITYGIKAKYDRSNLVVNDYYEPNSLIHKSTEDEEEEEKDNKETSLSEVAIEKEMISEKPKVSAQPAVSIESVMNSDNPDEAEYNKILLEYNKLVEEKAEIDRTFDSQQDLTIIQQMGQRLVAIRDRRKQIEKQAKELLPKFMPGASEELYKEVQKTIKDKVSSEYGTPEQDAKTKLVLLQLELVYGQK